MDLQLNGKIVIISGGARGIGEAITWSLVSEGAIPVVVGKSADSGKEIVRKIEERGGKALFIQMLLGAGDTCKKIIDETIKVFGRIDGIVNNAGVNDGVGLENGSPDRFKDSVIMNLSHYYDLVHYALPHLKESKGSILNVSSKTAITGQGGTSGYAASKGAQLALTREWAVELASYGIRVNAIVPAEVLTPLYSRWLSSFDNPEQKLKNITSNIPLGKRMTKAEEIADTAVFLLSEKSSHTTGQWIFVDGGYVHFDRALNSNQDE